MADANADFHDYLPRYGDRHSYRWSSQVAGQDVITIQNPEFGEYFIGVYAFSTCEYNLVSVSSAATLTLLNGIPFRADLQAGHYEYFLMPVDRTDQDLTVTITALSGDPDCKWRL